MRAGPALSEVLNLFIFLNGEFLQTAGQPVRLFYACPHWSIATLKQSRLINSISTAGENYFIYALIKLGQKRKKCMKN